VGPAGAELRVFDLRGSLYVSQTSETCILDRSQPKILIIWEYFYFIADKQLTKISSKWNVVMSDFILKLVDLARKDPQINVSFIQNECRRVQSAIYCKKSIRDPTLIFLGNVLLVAGNK